LGNTVTKPSSLAFAVSTTARASSELRIRTPRI
jgi:hypothetical protein